MIYAQTFGACVAQLEHRFYGDTHPLPDLSDASLVYLSSEQVCLQPPHSCLSLSVDSWNYDNYDM
jgi:hypothetical protein